MTFGKESEVDEVEDEEGAERVNGRVGPEEEEEEDDDEFEEG